MYARFKQKCNQCKKNYVLVSGARAGNFIQCYDCQKSELEGTIKNPAMKKLFNIPQDFYKTSSFLRSIKSNYLKYGALSDKQLEAFKKVVKEMKEQAKEQKS